VGKNLIIFADDARREGAKARSEAAGLAKGLASKGLGRTL